MAREGTPKGAGASFPVPVTPATMLRAASSAALLVGLRFGLAVWGLGYIHPDEWFQASEVSGRDVLGVEAVIPWEYNATEPSRSIFNPLTSTHVSNALLLAWRQGVHAAAPLTAHEVVVATRMWCFLRSFVLDFVVVALARRCGEVSCATPPPTP